MVDSTTVNAATSICIDFSEPGSNFRAGGKVEGVVKVSIDGFCDANALVLNLKGEDYAQFV